MQTSQGKKMWMVLIAVALITCSAKSHQISFRRFTAPREWNDVIHCQFHSIVLGFVTLNTPVPIAIQNALPYGVFDTTILRSIPRYRNIPKQSKRGFEACLALQQAREPLFREFGRRQHPPKVFQPS